MSHKIVYLPLKIDLTVDVEDCWLWALGSSNPGGYGYIDYVINKKRMRAWGYRLMYENFVGEVPEGLQLDLPEEPEV